MNEYMDGQVKAIGDAIETRDGDRVVRILQHVAAEHSPEISETLTHELIITGMTKLAEQAHDGDPESLALLERLIATLIQPPTSD